MTKPLNSKPPGAGVRASDAERERVAKIVSDAASEGRLSLDEADERLNLIYATKFRHELVEFVTDLPDPAETPAQPAIAGAAARFPTRLRVHAAVAVALSVLVILRWVASDVPYFWPAGPIFLLFGSVLLHARFLSLSRRGRPQPIRQWELTPSSSPGDEPAERTAGKS